MSILKWLRCHVARLTLMFAGGIFVLSLLSSIPVDAGSGDLDPRFGDGGKVLTDFFGNAAEANALAVQRDGKMVAAGSARRAFLDFDFALARHNTDGSLDETFGAGGKVVTDFFGGNDYIYNLAIQPDGKIVAAGSAAHDAVNSDFALARYNPDGSLDETFGTGGKLSLDFFNNTDEAHGLLLQPDGKIVIGGNTNGTGIGLSVALARYNPDGSLDATFGAGGKVIVNRAVIQQSLTDLALQADGKIVAVGWHRPGKHSSFLLLRFTADGALDSGFGSGGEVTTEFLDRDPAATAVAMQLDGRIVVGGTAQLSSGPYVFELARYNSDGSLDATFGADGKVTTSYFPLSIDLINLLLQADGRLLAVGVAVRSHSDFAIMRYNHDGSLDDSFGNGGLVTTDFGGQFESASAAAFQPNGRLIVAGTVLLPAGSDMALAGYDTGFDAFDLCIQDDVSGNHLKFSSATGEYQFVNCRKRIIVTGKGVVRVRGCKIELQDIQTDRNLSARLSPCARSGRATLRLTALGKTFSISDPDITDNSRRCP
ncbi:MAG: hypothetical protein V7641_1739 [Blastocatellia bacterium]